MRSSMPLQSFSRRAAAASAASGPPASLGVKLAAYAVWRSRMVVIDSRDGTLQLIPFSERGSAYENRVIRAPGVHAFVCRPFKK